MGRESKMVRILYPFVKRSMDVLCAIVGLILLAPVFVVVYILIKTSSFRAPAFFKQERIGKNGKRFIMYKFRTMVPDAESKFEELIQFNEISGAMFKIKNDPRITQVGRFLRKSSIDELPQFVNVLKGNMSMVGPRPPLEREVEEYSEKDYMRLSVTPGCTGLWQVNGRNDVSFSEMVNLDLEYIQNMGFLLDIKILLKTLRVIFFPNSAY